MATGKRPKKHAEQEPDAPMLEPWAGPMPNFAGMQQQMSDLTRLINARQFSSEEELNDFLRAINESGQLPALPPPSPLEEAQDIIYDAWQTPSRTKRVKLAKKALSISPDCADAYLLLAQESAKSPEEALELLTKAIAAGERAIGSENFEKMEGDFWGIFETRPYMRAKEAYASLLWGIGQLDKAIVHFQDMLRLNPNDNQGVRYYLLELYLETGDDTALRALIKRYKDDYSANWAYTDALLLFRQEGAGKRATKKLNAALSQNPHVPNYLLGQKKLPKYMPELIGIGDENEALDYASVAIPFWLQTPGAVDWLRAVVEQAAE